MIARLTTAPAIVPRMSPSSSSVSQKPTMMASVRNGPTTVAAAMAGNRDSAWQTAKKTLDSDPRSIKGASIWM